MSSGKPLEPLEPSQEQKDTTICKLCRRQFAKYTCPACNVPYCCLVCFRSSAHNTCSESFYKKEVESDIHSRPSKSANERTKTLELLRKFEEDANDLSLDEVDSDDDDSLDVAQRFAGLNLDSLSSDAIWSMLTPEERKKFSKVMENPESTVAQELLASEQLVKHIDEPWWEASDNLPPSAHHPNVSKPKMLQLPSSMLKAPVSPYLIYNICAVCVAYAFVTRHLGTSPLCKLELGDPEYHAGRKLFSRLIPFATDKKSAKIFEDLSDLTTDLWSRFGLDDMTNKLFALLLQDAAALLATSRVTEVTSTSGTGDFPDLSSHSHKIPLLVLSDLFAFYSKGTAGDSHHIAHKFLFYAAHAATTPTLFLEALSKEAQIRAKQYEEFHG